MASAFRQMDSVTFDEKAQRCRDLLSAIEALLQHDDYYWISPSIRQARMLPGAPANIDQRARDILTLWQGKLRDYACRDTFEMLRGYYRPRWEAFIAELRYEMKNGQRYAEYQPGESRVAEQCNRIEEKWVQDGCPLVDRRPDPNAVIELAKDVLRRFGRQRVSGG
jgi:hypothetical protein